jgi:transcription elongation factor GreA
LKENSAYHAAREEQGKNEARINELEKKLKSSTISKPSDTSEVKPLTVVTSKMPSGTQKFLVASRELAPFTELDVYSPESPLGVAIVGKKVGDATNYKTPGGKKVRIEILDIEPFKE